jgi:hypothetical protein
MSANARRARCKAIGFKSDQVVGELQLKWLDKARPRHKDGAQIVPFFYQRIVRRVE